MDVAHFYHAFCGGDWQLPVSEHLFALDQTGFDGPITVGLVGPKRDRGLVRDIFAAVHPKARFVEATSGFEQVTLHAAHEWAKTHDGAVLYAHTKGAAHPSDLQAPWRQAMTMHVVSQWRQHLPILAGPWVDAIGCHWLIPECWPSHFKWTSPMFGGNFWIARCDYLRKLPTCGTENRGQAETWIGLGRPSIVDLLPGTPSMELDRPPIQVGRLQVHVRGRLHPQVD